jgi:hypothetical protein
MMQDAKECEELIILQCTEVGTEGLKGNLTVDAHILKMFPAQAALSITVNFKLYYKARNYSVA